MNQCNWQYGRWFIFQVADESALARWLRKKTAIKTHIAFHKQFGKNLHMAGATTCCSAPVCALSKGALLSEGVCLSPSLSLAQPGLTTTLPIHLICFKTKPKKCARYRLSEWVYVRGCTKRQREENPQQAVSEMKPGEQQTCQKEHNCD